MNVVTLFYAIGSKGDFPLRPSSYLIILQN